MRSIVANVASIQAMVDAAIAAAGPIDILVNNAGVTRRIGILDMSEEQWDWIQSINTRGLFFCLQIVALNVAVTFRVKQVVGIWVVPLTSWAAVRDEIKTLRHLRKRRPISVSEEG